MSLAQKISDLATAIGQEIKVRTRDVSLPWPSGTAVPLDFAAPKTIYAGVATPANLVIGFKNATLGHEVIFVNPGQNNASFTPKFTVSGTWSKASKQAVRAVCVCDTAGSEQFIVWVD